MSVGNFYIGETEVTQGLIKAVYGVYYESLVGMQYKGDNYPIGDFSWYDCQDFIEKLNKQTGLNFCLPTEEQWEFAARGGNKSRGYMFSGSNNADEVAWYWDNSGGSIHEVGSKKANELGIYDMTGNVREWCQPEGFEWSQTTKTLCGDMHIRGGDYMYVNVRDKLKVCKATGSLTYHHNLGSGFRLCLKD